MGAMNDFLTMVHENFVPSSGRDQGNTNQQNCQHHQQQARHRPRRINCERANLLNGLVGRQGCEHDEDKGNWDMIPAPPITPPAGFRPNPDSCYRRVSGLRRGKTRGAPLGIGSRLRSILLCDWWASLIDTCSPVYSPFNHSSLGQQLSLIRNCNSPSVTVLEDVWNRYIKDRSLLIVLLGWRGLCNIQSHCQMMALNWCAGEIWESSHSLVLPLWMNVIECYDGSTHELHSVQFKFTYSLTLNWLPTGRNWNYS